MSSMVWLTQRMPGMLIWHFWPNCHLWGMSSTSCSLLLRLLVAALCQRSSHGEHVVGSRTGAHMHRPPCIELSIAAGMCSNIKIPGLADHMLAAHVQPTLPLS